MADPKLPTDGLKQPSVGEQIGAAGASSTSLNSAGFRIGQYGATTGLTKISPYVNNLVPTHSPHGMFGEFPGQTPKYARNTGARGDDYRETWARLFIQLPSKDALDAYLREIQASSPETLPLATMLAGTGSQGGNGYIDFILTSAQHAFMEKAEKIEFLNDDFVVYYYGQAIPTFSYNGMLMNTYQDDQVNNLFRLYREMLRGTALAKTKQAVMMKYSGFIVTGYWDAFGFNLQSDNENVCQFNFQVTVKEFGLAPNLQYGLAPLSSPFDGASLSTANQVTGTTAVQSVSLPAPGSAADVSLPSSPLQSNVPEVPDIFDGINTTLGFNTVTNQMVMNVDGG